MVSVWKRASLKTIPCGSIKRALDLSFVRPEVSGFYGRNGNVSVDPEVIVKLMLLLFLEDIPSERELMERLPCRLDYLWFLDYGMDDVPPNHSVLSKARRRWGLAIFEKLFVRSVQQCCDAGLVEGQKLYVDGSLIDANASHKSVKRGSPELLAVLSAAYQREERKLDEPSDPVPGEDVDPDGSSGGSASSGGYQPVNHNLLCTTDPDAANNHGFKRSRWRGLRWQKVQDWLIACCQNLRILVSNRIPDRARAAQQSVKTALIICFKVSWNELSPIFAPVRYLRPILGM